MSDTKASAGIEPPRDQRAFTSPITLLLLLQLFTGMVVAPVTAFFPVYLKDLGYTTVLISAIVTLQRIMGLVSSLVGGTLADSLGSRLTLILGQVAFFAGALLFLGRNPVSISVIWAVCGFGLGLNALGSQTYLMENANHAHLGMLSAFYYWGYTLGGAAANPVAGALIGLMGYRHFTPFMVVPAVATLVVTMLFLPRSGHDHLASERSSRPALTGMLGYGDIVKRPVVLMIAGLRFLPTFCYGIMVVFVPLQLKAAGASLQIIAIYAAVSSVCASVAQLIAGRVADRVSWKIPTVVAFTLLAGSTMAMGLVPGNLWAVFVLATIGIAAAWSLSTLLPTLVAKATGSAERGRVLGYAQLFWNVAMILSSVSGGFLYEDGKGLPFLVGGAVCACAIVLAAAFFRRVEVANAEAGYT